MLVYPHLIAALDALDDLDQLAADAGVTVGSLRILRAGGFAVSPDMRVRIARALGADPDELFRLPVELEAGLPAERFVTEPHALRIIDGGRS